jgi:LemA protein
VNAEIIDSLYYRVQAVYTENENMKRLAGAVVLLAFAWMGGMKFGAIRADLSAKQAAIGAAWEELAAALDQRASLVPALLNAVGARPSREPDLAASLRAASTPTGKFRAYENLDTAIDRLLETAMRSGARPDENFLRLREDLAESANRIAIARRRYNDSIQRYNTALELFPANAVAFVLGYKRVDAYFPTPPLV